MPTYLKYEYIFFFISNRGRIRIFFSAEPDQDPWKKNGILILGSRAYRGRLDTKSLKIKKKALKII